MQLFVIRHAIAEEARPGQDDASRVLTDEGERKLRMVVQAMRDLEWRFDRVLTSPWARAARTAELLAPIRTGAPVETELLCKGPTPELLDLLALTGVERLAVVGHEPWLGELVAWLAFGNQRHGERLQLKKASVTWLDGPLAPGAMMLRAMVPPKLMRGPGD